MVKNLLCIISFCLLFLSCRSVYIPKEYFDNYTKITSCKQGETFPFKTNGAYISSFQHISFFNFSDSMEYFTYTFYYQNQLCCTVTIPLISGKGDTVLNETDLIRAIRSGTINDRLSWSYFELNNGKINGYSLYEFIDGPVIWGYTLPISFGTGNIENDTLLLGNGRCKLRKKFIFFKWNETSQSNLYESSSKFKPLKLKPDSLNNSFIKHYENYLKTGSRLYRNGI